MENKYFSSMEDYNGRFGILRLFPAQLKRFYFSMIGDQDAYWNVREYERLAVSRGKIIELGCGQGHFLKYAKDHGIDAIGLDINKTEIASLKEQGFNVMLKDVSKPLPFKDASFDMAISEDVIEHIFDPTTFLSEIRRVVKPGGRAAIRTYDADRCSFGFFYGDPTHVRPYTKPSLCRLLTMSGFEIEETFYGCAVESFFLRRIGNVLLLTPPTRKIYRWICRMFTKDMCVIARRTP